MTIYCYSDSDEHFHFTMEAESIDTVVDEARQCYPDRTVYVGTQRTVDPGAYIDGDDITNWLSERAYDNIGEAAEGWPEATREQEAELTELLQAVIRLWLKATGNEPQFYAVDDVQSFPPGVTQ